METYGPTIRQIRLDKGFRQKEIYSGIVSKSYAIAFEKGQHQMGLNHFEKTLERLYLTYDEFIYIKNGYQGHELQPYAEIYADASNTGNLAELKKNYLSLADQLGFKATLQKNLIYLSGFSIASLTNHSDIAFWEQTAEPIKFIKNYLLGVESWTLFELAVFANSLSYFPISLTTQLMERSLQKLANYQHFQATNRLLAATLINFIDQLVDQNEWSKVNYFLPALKEISDSIDMSFERIIYLFFEGELNYALTKDPNSLKQIDQCIAMMSLLDHPKFLRSFQTAKATLLKNYQ